MLYTIVSSDYLQHHGILGMHWGIRRFQNKDGSLTNAGRNRYGVGDERQSSEEEESSKKKGLQLTDKQKKIIKIGAAVVATGLVAYGGYKLAKKAGILDKYMVKSGDAGNDLVKGITHKAGSSGFYNKEKAQNVLDQIKEKNPDIDIKIKSIENTLEENVKLSNPGYYENRETLRNNCSHSCVSWILNEIGLDVKAKPMSDEFIDGGMTAFEFKRFFKGTNFNEISASTGNEMRKAINNKILDLCNGEDGMGVFQSSQPTGHFMGWICKNGEVQFVNPQNGSFNCDAWLDASNNIINLARLDNLEINPKYILHAVTNS